MKHHLAARGIPDHRADEVIQEAMLRIWRRAELFDAQQGTAGGWIFAITRSCLVDYLRRRPELKGEVPAPAMLPEAPPPGTRTADAVTDTRDLARALATLPREQADTICQAYYRGFSLAEIATRQRLPLGTVKTRARLGLARLRERFGAKRTP